jgi:hypothetical protein
MVYAGWGQESAGNGCGSWDASAVTTLSFRGGLALLAARNPADDVIPAAESVWLAGEYRPKNYAEC